MQSGAAVAHLSAPRWALGLRTRKLVKNIGVGIIRPANSELGFSGAYQSRAKDEPSLPASILLLSPVQDITGTVALVFKGR